MTALVTSRKLMRPENTYLHRSQKPWKTFHQHWQHWNSILKGCATSLNCWNQALIPDPDLPSPAAWGWKKDQTGWQPVWTTLPEASQSCSELIIRCGCKKGCTGRCKCFKATLKCIAALVIASTRLLLIVSH